MIQQMSHHNRTHKVVCALAFGIVALLTLTGCQQQAGAQTQTGAYVTACHSQAQWLARVAHYQRAQEGTYAANDDLFGNFVGRVKPKGAALVVFSYQRLPHGARITVYCPQAYSVEVR